MRTKDNPWKPIKIVPRYGHTRVMLRARFPPDHEKHPNADTDAVPCYRRTYNDEWEGWYHKFPPTHWAYDPSTVDLPPVLSDGKDLTVAEREMKVLSALDYHGSSYDSYAYGFDHISYYTGLDRNCVRLTCRALTRKGDAVFINALSNDDGEFAGAGYSITKQGAKRLKSV